MVILPLQLNFGVRRTAGLILWILIARSRSEPLSHRTAPRTVWCSAEPIRRRGIILIQQFRQAARQIWRAPVLFMVAVFTLAIGLGANSAIFSIVYAVLIRPLPFAGAERMSVLSETLRGEETAVGPGQDTIWAHENRSFSAISAQAPATFNLSGSGAPERLTAWWVTSSFFRTHVLPAAAGRYFLDDEERDGVRAVVLSYAFFERRFGADPRAVGTTMRLNGEPFTIVGVAPRDFSLYDQGERGEQLWALMSFTAVHRADFDSHWLRVVGLRKSGVSTIEAQHDLERVTARIRESNPAQMVDRAVRVVDYGSRLVARFERQLLVLFGSVAIVLLLTCVNVANLLLARASARRTEIAVRSALGATRLDLVRQFAAEGVMLATVAAALSVGVSSFALSLIVRLAPVDIPRLGEARVDLATLGLLATVAVAIGVTLGVLTALRATHRIQDRLRGAGRGMIEEASRDRTRRILVTAQIAFAFALLIGAALFGRSGLALGRVDSGFDAKNLLTFRVSLPYQENGRVVAGFRDLLARLEAVPGVRSVAAASTLPLDGVGVDVDLRVDGRQYAPGAEPNTHVRVVSPDYFRAMGIALRSGRPIGTRDGEPDPRVVVINERLARLLFPNENPLGRKVACCGDAPAEWREVVGVVSGVRSRLMEEPVAELYLPMAQAPTGSWSWFANSLAFAVRSTDAPVTRLLPQLRQAVAEVDPAVPLWGVQTSAEATRQAGAANRFSLQLLSALAAVALLLSAVGLYAILAHFIAERRREIGVRLALGASVQNVLALVLRQGLVVAAGGFAAGIPLALLGGRAVSSLLYGTAPTDPIVYGIVGAMLLLIILLASYLPARRAARLDPAITLRS